MKNYLENLLATLDDKANVMVKLSSTTVWLNDIETQDGCGNHYACNWKDAIDRIGRAETFVIKSVEYSVADWMDSPQWVVVLENVKDTATTELSYWSNYIACYGA